MKYVPSALQDANLAAAVQRELRRIQSAIDSMQSEGWTDLRFPAQGINLSGSPAPPSVDNSTSAMAVAGTLLFSGTLENDIAGLAQFPHGFVSGKVEPHIHYRKETSSANGVAWKLYYNILGNPGDQPVGWVGPISGTLAAGDDTVAYEHCIVAFDQIDLTSYHDSVCLAWRIAREGNSDSYAAVARLFEFDIHYRQRAFGSPDIYDRKNG